MKQELKPNVNIVAQYTKDLSFESPNAPNSLIAIKDSPDIDLALDIQVSQMAENTFEVSIEISAKAKSDEDVFFVVELVYAGLFELENIPESEVQILLAVHCPGLIFPFARQIIANVTQNGGFQPLMIDPIDFFALYQKRMAELAMNSEESREND